MELLVKIQAFSVAEDCWAIPKADRQTDRQKDAHTHTHTHNPDIYIQRYTEGQQAACTMWRLKASLHLTLWICSLSLLLCDFKSNPSCMNPVTFNVSSQWHHTAWFSLISVRTDDTQSHKLLTKTLKAAETHRELSIMLTSYADVIYSMLNHYELWVDTNEFRRERSMKMNTDENLCRDKDGQRGGWKFQSVLQTWKKFGWILSVCVLFCLIDQSWCQQCYGCAFLVLRHGVYSLKIQQGQDVLGPDRWISLPILSQTYITIGVYALQHTLILKKTLFKARKMLGLVI